MFQMAPINPVFATGLSPEMISDTIRLNGVRINSASQAAEIPQRAAAAQREAEMFPMQVRQQEAKTKELERTTTPEGLQRATAADVLAVKKAELDVAKAERDAAAAPGDEARKAALDSAHVSLLNAQTKLYEQGGPSAVAARERGQTTPRLSESARSVIQGRMGNLQDELFKLQGEKTKIDSQLALFENVASTPAVDAMKKTHTTRTQSAQAAIDQKLKEIAAQQAILDGDSQAQDPAGFGQPGEAGGAPRLLTTDEAAAATQRRRGSVTGPDGQTYTGYFNPDGSFTTD